MKKHHAIIVLGPMLLLPILTGCGNTVASPPSASGYNASPTNSTATTSGPTAPTASNASWMQFDKNTQTVMLNVTAALSNDNNGFNFNGFSNGAMTVTVPLGWHVNISFMNKSTSMPHSLEIVPHSERTLSGGFTPAFSGASTPQPEAGITSGQTQHVTFTADKAGQYAIVCAVPGHSSEGLWDNFVVSSIALMPTIAMNSGQTSGSSSSSGNSSYGSGW